MSLTLLIDRILLTVFSFLVNLIQFAYSIALLCLLFIILCQLLEERDSLQLRLSTAIRFNQELREKSQLLDEAAIKMEGEASFSSEADDNSNNQQLKEK